MTDRDRLIGIIRDIFHTDFKGTDEEGYAEFADYLISNGVIVPMCYIGQPIWYICEHVYAGTVEIEEGKISMIQQKADKSWKFRITVNSSVWDFTPEKIGTRYFLTKEEAEQAIREREV